jgi:hypothetical protein
MGLLDPLLRKVLHIAGVALPERGKWDIVSGATAVDNPITKVTEITIAGGGATAPTGTGVATVTAGNFDAAASLGTALQVLRTNAGATDTEWADINPAGVCRLEDFGAVGDGVTNDSAAFTAALDAVAAGTYGTLQLGAKTYLCDGYNWDGGAGNGGTIVGHGSKSILKYRVASVSFASPAMIYARNIDSLVLRDFVIQGDGVLAQRGMLFGLADSTAPQHLDISGVHCLDLTTCGMHFTNPPAPTSQIAQVAYCRAYNCGVGVIVGAELGVSNVNVSGCTIGVEISAGNLSWNGGVINENDTGILLEPSGNDGHGTFTGTTINHNTTYGIDSQGIANGMTFAGCHVYANDVRIKDNTGIIDFIGCSLEPVNLTFDNCLVRFVACRLNTAVFSAATYSNNPQVTYRDVLDLAGDIPSFVQDKVQNAYTFPTDANQTLTKMQSVAETLNIAAGVITAGRTLTSTLSSVKSRKIMIKNNTAFTITYQWATGTGVTIATGKSAIIGSDGTNAIVLLQGV